MVEESEDLKFLKSIEHPCGHFELALKEIKKRDDRISELETLFRQAMEYLVNTYTGCESYKEDINDFIENNGPQD